MGAIETAGSAYTKMRLAQLLKCCLSVVSEDDARAADMFRKPMAKAVGKADSAALHIALDVVKDVLWDDAPEVVEEWISAIETVVTLSPN